MPVKHQVRKGDDISSIAAKHGFTIDTLWNDPANKDLKDKRKDPDVLNPGDIVIVPDKRQKEETIQTEQRHRFRKKGTTARLKIQLMDDNTPKANAKYTLQVDGHFIEGTTNGDGFVDESIQANAKQGWLLCEGEDPIPLSFGALDPINTVKGVQDRLMNLGYDCSGELGRPKAKTKQAIEQFQQDNNLTVTGKIDQTTADQLKALHGS